MEKPTKSLDLDRKMKPDNNVWDTGSDLYDSFELKSFQNSLNSAITASRTFSMPHLSERQPPPPPPQRHHIAPKEPAKKSSSKFSKPFQKFVRTIFGSRQRSRAGDENRFYVVLDKSGVLTTIPEVHETAPGLSVVDRSVSERFGPGSIGMISCA
ncbi:uncharacterized protein LOC124930483 [Impatiens glandulifera]|uniref:uncharacterized protein LOC124930483 n=1 Tax=Impatiens glandulifera TaxID=253017 RepID=UPI001FB0F12B|nr:uncharacterized protein LOC124930483 [Impatiens glandulifera]